MGDISESNKCYDCEKRFVNAMAAFQHCRDLGHDHAWECGKCDFFYASKDNRDDHFKSRHMATKHSHSCRDCSKTFTTRSGLESHASTCHNLTCSECGKLYEDKKQFDEHLSSGKHAAAIRKYNASKKPVPKTEVLICPVCSSKSFKTKDELAIHHFAHIMATDEKKEPVLLATAPNASIPAAGSLKAVETCTTPAPLAINSPPGPFGHRKAGVGESTSSLSKSLGDVATNSTFESNSVAFGASADSPLPPSTPESKGTGSVPFQMTVLSELNSITNQLNAFQCINFQAPYRKFSFEELRLADYPQGSLAPAEKSDTKVSKYCCTDVSTQTTSYQCDTCVTTFDTAEELQSHNETSPFHGPRDLACYECSQSFPDQISLLQHIESKPHHTRWVLSMI